MPNYDYHCSSCSHTEEISQRITEEAITKCPKCGEDTFNRVVTGGAGVLYKGEGWYVTDYSKKSSGGKDTSAALPPSTPASAATTATPAPSTTPTTAPTKTE